MEMELYYEGKDVKLVGDVSIVSQPVSFTMLHGLISKKEMGELYEMQAYGPLEHETEKEAIQFLATFSNEINEVLMTFKPILEIIIFKLLMMGMNNDSITSTCSREGVELVVPFEIDLKVK